MKKENLSNISIKRISTSPYLAAPFLDLEKAKIQQLPNAIMLPFNSNEVAHILITNTHTNLLQIDQKQLAACKLIIHPNSGYDNFPAHFVKNINCPIVIGNPIRAHAVVNYILSALYSHFSPILPETKWSETRKWPRKLLSEISITILGRGHIGLLLEKSLSPLTASCQIFDPYQGFNNLSLNNTDVVITACSLNRSNHRMIDKEFLSQLNEDFLLINAARGELVHTFELLDVLKMRPQAFAILDVFEKEPADLSIFNNIKNIKVSSHIAGVYQKIDDTIIDFEVKVINDFLTLIPAEFEKKYHKMILKNRLINDGFLDDFLI